MAPSYVYLWSSPTYDLLYVGKGKNGRAGAHLADKPWARGADIRCDVRPCDSEEEAVKIESLLVQLFRGSGLHNRCVPRSYHPELDLGWALNATQFPLSDVVSCYGVPERYKNLTRFVDALETMEELEPNLFDYDNAFYEYMRTFEQKNGAEHAHLGAVIAFNYAGATVEEIRRGIDYWKGDR